MTLLRETMMPILDVIVSKQQAAFMRERRISDHIVEVMERFYDDKRLKVHSRFLFLDFEKAFDRVDHDALWSTLATQGWDPALIKIIRLLYTDVEMYILWQRCPSVPRKESVRAALCRPYCISSRWKSWWLCSSAPDWRYGRMRTISWCTHINPFRWIR